MELRSAAAAVAGLVLWLAAPAAAQTNCTTDGDLRQSPFCYNAPNTALAAPGDGRVINGTNDGFTTQAGERLSCPRADGGDGSYGATTWYAFHAHAAGYLGVLLQGIDAQLVMEEGTGAPDASRTFVCSDDSGAIDHNQELLAVRGLEAGKTYLLQIGGLKRGTGAPDEGDFVMTAGFVPDRDNDVVGDADDACPDVAAEGSANGCPPNAPPAGGGGGGSPTPTPGGGLAPSDPDPDRDGIRGPADNCPDKGTRGRDINQDGCEDRRRQTVDVKWRIVPTSGRGVIIKELRLKGAGKGTKVSVRCSRGCRKLTLSPSRTRLTVSAGRMRAGRLSPGTTIDVSVSRPGYNGETHHYKVLKTTMDESWTRCLPEGKAAPVKGACY
jgi:hypothetical protein